MAVETVLVKGADITEYVNADNASYTAIVSFLNSKLGFDVTRHDNPAYALFVLKNEQIRAVYLTHSDLYRVYSSGVSVTQGMSFIEKREGFDAKVAGVISCLNELGSIRFSELDYYVDHTQSY